LVDRTRVSTNGPWAASGTAHTNVMIAIVELPWFKLEIGRDPDEIENHDPIENDPD